MAVSLWKSLSERQAQCLEQTEQDLKDAERFIAAKEMKDAKLSYKIAKKGIEELRRVHKDRRGQPRQDLDFKIRCLIAWRIALLGALDITTMGVTSETGLALLRHAHEDAKELLTERPDTPGLTELIDKIDRWTVGTRSSHKRAAPVIHRN